MADNIDKWRGFKALVQDAVQQGASAVERVHLDTAKRPFNVLKSIAPIEKPVENIEAIHDTIVSSTYAAVRAVTQVAGKVVDTALDALDDGEKKPEGSPTEPPSSNG